MRIDNTFSVLSNTFSKTYVLHKVTTEGLFKQEETPIRVDLSEEGKERYRKSLSHTTESYDRMIAQRDELLDKEKAPKILTDYGFLFGNKLNELKKDDEYRSIGSQANELLTAYASLYDEIVRGYETGTRACYVEDSASESGCRKLTMSEEISLLDEAYKKYADFIESQAQQWPELAELYDKYVKQLAEIGVKSEQASEAAETFSKHVREGIPKNISKKLVTAAKTFVMQYANLNGGNMDIKDMLKGIVVFE